MTIFVLFIVIPILLVILDDIVKVWKRRRLREGSARAGRGARAPSPSAVGDSTWPGVGSPRSTPEVLAILDRHFAVEVYTEE